MTKAEQEWSLIEALVYCKGKRLTKKSCAGCPYAGTGCAIDATIAKLKAQEQEPRTCSECRHYDTNAFTDMGGKCRNSLSCHYCYGCDKSFGCNAWEWR